MKLMFKVLCIFVVMAFVSAQEAYAINVFSLSSSSFVNKLMWNSAMKKGLDDAMEGQDPVLKNNSMDYNLYYKAGYKLGSVEKMKNENQRIRNHDADEWVFLAFAIAVVSVYLFIILWDYFHNHHSNKIVADEDAITTNMIKDELYTHLGKRLVNQPKLFNDLQLKITEVLKIADDKINVAEMSLGNIL